MNFMQIMPAPTRQQPRREAANEEQKPPSVASIVANVLQDAEPGTEPDALAEQALEAIEDAFGVAGFRKLQTRILTEWACEQLRNSRHAARVSIINLHQQAPGKHAANPDRNVGGLVSMWRRWMQFPIDGGPLGEATKLQVMATADRYRKVAKASKARADWLAAIAEALPDDSATVSTTLTETQLAGMAKQFGVVNDQGGV